ncbi:ABC-2 type transport system permease protein [Kribbella voronezhensis]|uniref:ABC-2 type transport system permease protein n=1 Tax=Kribbella voronezhensis TaxID=2512212 RepID=A0A4R7SWB9_9ACTN|nr:ABC-2 family transporter protein [Kribbella voronezhensis]TDU83215.1 ABC-2 type transport system permease protein [Kribbella voronezhensis]
MSKVRRLLRLLRLEIWRQFIGWSGAWWFLVTLVVGQSVAPLLGLLIWLEVPSAGPRIGSYYLAVICVGLVTASFENHTFAQSIYSGGLATALLRPQPPVLGPLGENLAIRLWMLLLGMPLIAAVGLSVGASFSVPAVLAAVPALVLAAVLRFLWVWTLAMAAFWTERVHGVVAFGGVLILLIGGSAAPIALLPEPLRSIAQLLPFRSMLGFPAELATGTLTAAEAATGYLVALFWVGALACSAVGAWRLGIRRYSTVGA